MHARFLMGLCGWALVALSAVTGSAVGEGSASLVAFQSNFDSGTAGGLAGWQGGGELEVGFRGGQALMIRRGLGSAEGAHVAWRDLPVEGLRGSRCSASAMVKGADITRPPRPWNGVKFMLQVEAPSVTNWPAARFETGDLPWHRATFGARIPTNATRVRLILGLEAVTGTAWFDDVRIAAAPPRVREPWVRPATVHRGHDLPRLRGAMVASGVDDASLRVLGKEWGANLVRWQLVRSARPGETVAPAEYRRWLEAELVKTDAVVESCGRHGLKVVVDLHSPPGGRGIAGGYLASEGDLFAETWAQAEFAGVWERIATRYRGNPVIWGFDLVNEPVEGYVGEGCLDWHDLAERTARAINRLDPERTIIVEPSDWGGAEALGAFEPIAAANVVYSFHMYQPTEFTHQSVFGGLADVRYPGLIGGREWDRKALRAALAPAVEFQRRYGVHLYVGEFSAIRWAPEGSAFRYLRDLTELFEEHGWDWSYHAFREWQGWSVEHDEVREHTAPAGQPTERQRLLQERFGRNVKPASRSSE